MMNYEIFKEVVKEKFMDYMPDSFKGMELIVRPAEKVNMTYDAINIRGEDTTISPTIYINDMYEKYQSCGDLEETLMAACDLMAMEFAKTPQVVDVDSLYKDADEKVVFQLINTEQNKSFLEQVPHREFQDLSIIYKLVVNADTESIQSIKVTNSLAERLGMNEEQLFKYAAENTRRILPPRIRNMNDVMKEMFLSDGMPEEIAEMMIREVPPEQTLWIISNNRGIDGAVSMLYENELHELAANLCSCVTKSLRKFASVAVPYSVCTPFVHYFKSFFDNVHICRNCYSAFAFCHILPPNCYFLILIILLFLSVILPCILFLTKGTPSLT